MILQKRCRECEKNIKKIDSRISKGIVRIVFILEMPEVWNSCKTVFEAFENMENAEAYILAVPKFPNTKLNPAYEFASIQYKNVINGYDEDTEEWFDLFAFGPDYIFYTRPYQREYPDYLRSRVTSRYAKNCYIPYGYEFVTGYHIEVEYNLNSLPYLYMIFCEGISSKSYCNRLVGNTSKKIFDMGYPRFDLLNKFSIDRNDGIITTILWTPRWSSEKRVNDGTSFFKFIEPLLELFQRDDFSNTNLIIRPHPLMFPTFIKNKIMDLEDVSKLFDRVDQIKNISFDKTSDYLLTAHKADLIISDFSSMLIEFLMMNKPIIYCGKTDSFDATGIKINSVMYHVDKDEGIIKCIERIMKQGDDMYEKRCKVITELGNGLDGRIGEKIAGCIMDDYNKSHLINKN